MNHNNNNNKARSLYLCGEACISTPASLYPYLHTYTSTPRPPHLCLHTHTSTPIPPHLYLWRESGLRVRKGERNAKGKTRPFNRPVLPPIVYVRMSCSCSAKHHLPAALYTACCIGSPSPSAMADHSALGPMLSMPSFYRAVSVPMRFEQT